MIDLEKINDEQQLINLRKIINKKLEAIAYNKSDKLLNHKLVQELIKLSDSANYADIIASVEANCAILLEVLDDGTVEITDSNLDYVADDPVALIQNSVVKRTIKSMQSKRKVLAKRVKGVAKTLKVKEEDIWDILNNNYD